MGASCVKEVENIQNMVSAYELLSMEEMEADVVHILCYMAKFVDHITVDGANEAVLCKGYGLEHKSSSEGFITYYDVQDAPTLAH